MILEKHLVPPTISPQRLSDYAIGIFTTINTRNGIKKCIKKQLILVDGVIGETGTWVQPNQVITLSQEKSTTTKVFPLDLVVVYEDDYVAAVNKPAGIPVSGNQFKTIKNALLGNLKLSTQKDALIAPLPVHRLDSPTSGILLIAKTHSALVHLGRQFENKETQKTYRAIAMGNLPEQGRINTDVDGKGALTTFQKIKMVNSLRSEQLSLVELTPHTGRTHQLRIHLSSIGCPILGDDLYGKEGNILKHKGLFLCSEGLSFTHPVLEDRINLTIETPNKYDLILEREEQRWGKFKSHNQ